MGNSWNVWLRERAKEFFTPCEKLTGQKEKIFPILLTGVLFFRFSVSLI